MLPGWGEGVTEHWELNLRSIHRYYQLQVGRQLTASELFKGICMGTEQLLVMCMLITFTSWVKAVSRAQVSNQSVCTPCFRTLTHMWEWVKSCMKQWFSLLPACLILHTQLVLLCTRQSVEQLLSYCDGPSLTPEAWYSRTLNSNHLVLPLYLFWGGLLPQ